MNGAPRLRFISWYACWSFALLTTKVTEKKRLAVKLALIGKQDARSFLALSFVHHQSWHFHCQCKSKCKNGHFKLRLCKLPICLTEAMKFSLWRFEKVIFSDDNQVGWKFYGTVLTFVDKYQQFLRTQKCQEYRFFWVHSFSVSTETRNSWGIFLKVTMWKKS